MSVPLKEEDSNVVTNCSRHLFSQSFLVDKALWLLAVRVIANSVAWLSFLLQHSGHPIVSLKYGSLSGF